MARRRGWRRRVSLLILYVLVVFFLNLLRIMIASEDQGDASENDIDGRNLIFNIYKHGERINASKTMTNSETGHLLKGFQALKTSLHNTGVKTRNSTYSHTTVTPSNNSSGSVCGGHLSKPGFGHETQTFQPFRDQGHVFSAHYDPRDHAVKVIALGTHRQGQVFCQTWFREQDAPGFVKAQIRIMPENHNKPKFGLHFSCILKGPDIPYAVSLVSTECEQPRNILYVPSIDPSSYWKRNFTLCTTPMFHKFDDSAQLVEFIEVNRIFGVEHFVFYNLSIGAEVDRYLRHYMTTGAVDVIQWPLPPDGPTDSYGGVYYFAQVAAYTDCLQRSVGKSVFISFTDLDEIIVPHAHGTFHKLTEHYRREFSTKCSIIFRNAFFRTDWPSDPYYSRNSTVNKYQIKTLLKTLRENKIWISGRRSKYLAKVSHLVVPGIHFPSMCGRIGKWFTAYTRDALLHHYRAWGDTVPHHDAVKDRYMFHNADEMIRRIQGVHEKLGWREKT